jgi:hypothetical protein
MLTLTLFLTTPISIMLKMTFLTTALSGNAKTDFVDHAPYLPPRPVATGLRLVYSVLVLLNPAMRKGVEGPLTRRSRWPSV